MQGNLQITVWMKCPWRLKNRTILMKTMSFSSATRKLPKCLSAPSCLWLPLAACNWNHTDHPKFEPRALKEGRWWVRASRTTQLLPSWSRFPFFWPLEPNSEAGGVEPNESQLAPACALPAKICPTSFPKCLSSKQNPEPLTADRVWEPGPDPLRFGVGPNPCHGEPVWILRAHIMTHLQAVSQRRNIHFCVRPSRPPCPVRFTFTPPR